MTYDALIVAGGRARRLGGADKPSLTVGGRSLLDRTLDACADAARTIVVGPRRPTTRPVLWTREQRPGSGPLAAVEAGLRLVRSETVLLLSADLPFLRPDTVRSLLAPLAAPTAPHAPSASQAPQAPQAPDAPHGVLGVLADGGRDQPLLGAYRTEALRREAALIATEHGRLDDLPLRLLIADLTLARVAAPDAADCDTWDDIAAARARIREHGHVLEEWITTVKNELGIELDVDIHALLDLARDAAHGVDRPAAPLTTFLVGYAAAQAGGSPRDVAEAARKAAALATRWQSESDGPTP